MQQTRKGSPTCCIDFNASRSALFYWQPSLALGRRERTRRRRTSFRLRSSRRCLFSPTSPRTGSRSTISAASSISSPISAMARRISRAACAVAPSTPGVWRGFSKPTSEGGAVHFNTFAIHGRGLSRYNLNNILTASDIEALSTVRLSELWYEHRFFDKIYIRAGQLAADQEFLTSKLAGLFINGRPRSWDCDLQSSFEEATPSPLAGEGDLRVSEGRMRGSLQLPHPHPSLLRNDAFSHQGRRPRQ